MIGCHTNIATAPLSESHEAAVKTLPIQADLSWSPLPLVPLCTDAFSVFFSTYCIKLPFCIFCLNRHLPSLGPETHSLRACLSLCPFSNRVLSLSIALVIRLFRLMLRPLSSKLFFSRLPRGNLGEPSTKHTLCSLHILCCSVVTTLSSALTALCLLSYLSSLLLWPLLACCGLRRFFSIDFKRALQFVFSPRPAPKNLILRPAYLFSTSALAPIPINFEIFIVKFPFSVSNEICDDRHPAKKWFDLYAGHCLFRNSGFTVIRILKFRP